MLRKSAILVFIMVSLVLAIGCKEGEQQKAAQKKEQTMTVHIKPTPEQEEIHRKMTESRYKPSEKKEWKPF